MLELQRSECDRVSGGDGGWFQCIQAYTPYMLGAGICWDQTGEVYTSIGVGAPGLSFNTGYASNLNGYLTQSTVEAQAGGWFGGFNAGAAGGGQSFGTPSVSYSYGFDMGNISSLENAIGSFMNEIENDIANVLYAFEVPYGGGS